MLDEAERLVCINESPMAGDSLSECDTLEGARARNADLIKHNPSTSGHSETFCASKGWLPNFRGRTGIHSISRPGLIKGLLRVTCTTVK